MLLSKIDELISNGEISALRELLTEINVVDTAQLIEELESKDRLLVFRVLPKDISAEVFAYLEPEIQAELVRTINDAELERLLDEMFLDDTVDFLEEVPANVVTRVLAHSDPETRRLINRFLKYPDDCAGSLMTIEMVQLHTSFTAAQAIEHIRKTINPLKIIRRLHTQKEVIFFIIVLNVEELLTTSPNIKGVT